MREGLYKPILGQEQGEDMYNSVSFATGTICIGKDIYDLNKLLRDPKYLGNPSISKTFIKRQRNMPDNLPVKMTITEKGDEIIKRFTAYDAVTGISYNVKTEIIYKSQLVKQLMIDSSKGIIPDTINQNGIIEALE